MILVLEALLIVVLGVILATVFADEVQNRRRTKHLVKLKGYWNGKNRREVTRHNITLDVDYRINHSSKNSKTKDISTRGVGLVLEEKLKKKTPLAIEIKLDGQKEPIKVKGRIMWSKEALEDERYSPKRLFNTGIKFLKFRNGSQEKKLFDYIKSIENSSSQAG